MRRVVILGSTGSVGESAVRVAAALRDRIHVVGVVGNRNVKRLAEQAALLGCEFAATGSPERLAELASALPPPCRAHAGTDAVAELVQAENVDMILCAIVGTAGFPLVLAAIDAGKEIALASKEVLVMAGGLVMERVREKNIRLIPVDSEHSAIFQCLQGHGNVRNVVLTASGGPFRKLPKEELARVTCADALKHPTWSMGPKVTIDSASMMNKALEMVEAHHLFHVGADRIKVLVHPQSIVHSMAEFEDGAFLAHMSVPDMRFPIQYAFTWPERCDGGLKRLDLTALSGLTFEKPDMNRFPSLGYGREAIRMGGTAGSVMNAANEVAVERFAKGGIGFTDIFRIVERTMERLARGGDAGMEEILDADHNARAFARQI